MPMYNRYIPQPDGTYRRKRLEEPNTPVRPAPPTQIIPAKEETIPQPCPPLPPHEIIHEQPATHRQTGAGFLRQLLPKDFDAGDLIVIALLLLIAGDCEAERSNALLTLALYFSM